MPFGPEMYLPRISAGSLLPLVTEVGRALQRCQHVLMCRSKHRPWQPSGLDQSHNCLPDSRQLVFLDARHDA